MVPSLGRGGRSPKEPLSKLYPVASQRAATPGMEMLPRSTAATSAPKQQQTGSLSSQVAVLRDKNWKMKTRKQEVGEEITIGVMYSVMILFGLLSRNPIASPREFEFPVQHAPALDLKCGQGNDTSLLVYTPNDKTVNDALHDAIRLLDTPMCTEGFATREAAETALRTNSSLRDMTAAYVHVRAPSTSSEWSYSIALPSDVSSSLNLQAAANRPSFVRSVRRNAPKHCTCLATRLKRMAPPFSCRKWPLKATDMRCCQF